MTCGTNLEVVFQALSGSKTGFLAKADMDINQLLARYAKRCFKNASVSREDATVGQSWKLLGQGLLTWLADMVFVGLMVYLLPLRFLTLLISSPFKLLSQRSQGQMPSTTETGEQGEPQLFTSAINDRLLQPGPSISEQTTERLQQYQPPDPKRVVSR